ncbi:MAG: CBS domain-containing protein [Hyphomicrobiales bacterium]|nr:MAG: CBS domain-containing protein [Hyphomicrobiales bacterium]
MQVETILQSKGTVVHTVSTGTPVAEALRILNDRRIGAVVVTDDAGTVAGILSERDIVRHLTGDPAELLAAPVANIMTKTVITCGRDTAISELMEQMTRYRIRHIPIIEDGKLAGIVSIGDVVKRKIEEAEQEALALRDYIAS